MVQSEMQSFWESILDKLRNTTAESEYQRWILPMGPLSLSDKEFILGTPNDFSRTYIMNHYLSFLKDAAGEVSGRDMEIRIDTIEDKEGSTGEDILSAPFSESGEEKTVQTNLFPSEPSAPVPSSDSGSHFQPVSPGDHSSLKEKYTFETFVQGASNRFAHAAAVAVVNEPGKVYNPLFLYGDVGLGKTHLMHAIGNQILKNNPNTRVLYISSEKFLNDFIASIREGKPREFQNKYRNIDVLLVDDIQFLYTKERTQEEFFHTFNALYDADKAIILSADRHPRDIQIIEDRLRSRFEWGLITEIKPPDLETRIAILQKKAISMNVEILDNDIFSFIASRVDSNIRELEGALTRVVAQASLDNQEITLELAKKAMSGSYPTERSQSITLELIMDVTASYFHLTSNDLFSKKRTQDIAFARQIAMYLCREMTDTSLINVGKFFGGRDHTTVLHACEKISKSRQSDKKIDKTLNDLTVRIRQM